MATQTSSAGKKKAKPGKDAIEKFPPPDVESLTLDDQILFKSCFKNDYQTICGAFDAKEHPLAVYIIENGLFNRKDDQGKSVFDLAASIGHKDFIRTILERTNEKLDETVLNLRKLLNPAHNPYNLMHYACIWNQIDICKLLVDQNKLILEPSIDVQAAELISASTKNLSANPNYKTLGSLLLRTKAKTGETPRELAKRYNHDRLVSYLFFAEKRQIFVDNLNELKSLSNDPEKNQNKLSKDDKKKLDKLYLDSMDWLEKNKDMEDVEILEVKMREVNDEAKPILDRLNELIQQQQQQQQQQQGNSKSKSVADNSRK